MLIRHTMPCGCPIEVHPILRAIALKTSQVFSYEDEHGRRAIWDVDHAMRLVTHGPVGDRILAEVPVAALLDTNTDAGGIRDAHVDHVDPELPGLAVPWFDGTYTVIDGRHRAARRRRDGHETLPVFLLTADESRACLVAGVVPI